MTVVYTQRAHIYTLQAKEGKRKRGLFLLQSNIHIRGRILRKYKYEISFLELRFFAKTKQCNVP